MIKTFEFDNTEQITSRIADTCAPEQYIRELLWNSIQAVLRVGTGLVAVDYYDIDGVSKLRFYDTGCGMDRPELYERLGYMAASDRTGVNFGVGAKVSMVKVSPGGVHFITVKDGAAHELVYRTENGTFGVAILNPEASDDVTATTRPVDINDPRIPDDIRTAGHGTVVIVMGTGPDDSTSHSLRPDADESGWWLTKLINSRFTAFPEGVNVKVAGYKQRGGDKETLRSVKGSSVHIEQYITSPEAGQDRDIDLHGFYRKVKLVDTIPATAHVWVLPSKKIEDGKVVDRKGIPGYYRLGGRVRVCTDHEVYVDNVRALRSAGVWTNQHRVQIHIVPNADVPLAPDLSRSNLKVDGIDAYEALTPWCEEFARKQPAELKEFLSSGTAKTRKGDTAAKTILEAFSGLLAVNVRSNRGSSEGTLTKPTSTITCGGAGTGTGSTLTTTGGRDREGTAGHNPPRDRNGTKARLAKLRERFNERRTGNGATSTGQALGNTAGAAKVKGRLTMRGDLTVPDVRWVNTGTDDRAEDLHEGAAGFYEPGAHTVVLNAEFLGYTALLNSFLGKCKNLDLNGESVKDKVRGYVKDGYESHMRSSVTGALLLAGGDRARLNALLTEEALSVVGISLEEVTKRLFVTCGSNIKGGFKHAAAV